MLTRPLLMAAAAVSARAAAASNSSANLAQLALQQTLDAASPIFGIYQTNTTSYSSNYSTWMKAWPDSTQLVHMNIPGTHDSSTWNYTQATQNALLPITNLDGVTPSPAPVYRCQNQSYFDMLNLGIRVFDIRYSFDATNSSLVLYHSAALQSETALLSDVMFGFYQWLDDHPSETLLLSFMHESGTLEYDPVDAAVEMAIYEVLTSPAAMEYVVQAKNYLPTLGECRGKINLLRRFDLYNLSSSYQDSIPGLHFPPAQWVVNGPSFNITVNTTTNATVYLEDFYNILSPNGTGAAENIQWKLNATEANLHKATLPQYKDSLFWSFASSEYDSDVPISTPEIMAVGNGTMYTPQGGVNQHLAQYFANMTGQRLGIVMFDFFSVPSNLVPTFLGLLQPNGTSS